MKKYCMYHQFVGSVGESSIKTNHYSRKRVGDEQSCRPAILVCCNCIVPMILVCWGGFFFFFRFGKGEIFIKAKQTKITTKTNRTSSNDLLE